MADHEGWHAKETAYFLDREGAAFQHLRIFRVNCQLLPLHVTVKQHRAARMQRTGERSEEHTSELQSLMRISYAVFCLKKKNIKYTTTKIKPPEQHKTPCITQRRSTL